MTFPNRSNYTPGEKRRERKYQLMDPASTPMTSTSAVASTSTVANVTRSTTVQSEKTARSTVASPTVNDDDALRAELLEALSALDPDAADEIPSVENQADALSVHKKMLAAHKAQLETAHQRLLRDSCYQNLSIKPELTSFSAMIDANFQPTLSTADPLEQALAGIAADTGLEMPQSGQSRTRSMHKLDPHWASLFQQTGTERQALLNDLGKLDCTDISSMSELDAAMRMVDDPPTRSKYQRSCSNVNEWGKQRLYQQLRASIMSRGLVRSAPSSPIDSPLRQQPKKRTNLSKLAKSVLRAWFEDHLHHPYPTEEEKDWLSVQGGITIEQVNNWFINTRGRKWKPMLARIVNEKKTGGDSKLYDRLVEKLGEPYHPSAQ